MAADKQAGHFVFPKWSNLLLPALIVAAVGAPPYLGILVPLVGSPTTLNVGYQPEQPVPYSHELHSGQLGIDCRYCHTTVEDAAHAAIPPTETCMNCHHAILKNSDKLKLVRESYAAGDGSGGERAGMPIPWVKVHDLADYSYFDHAPHVNAGVSCVECHGRVDRMGEEGVWQVENLSMSWCIECHRNPEPHLRPRDEVTNLVWAPTEHESQAAYARHEELLKLRDIPAHQVLTDCSTCHR